MTMGESPCMLLVTQELQVPYNFMDQCGT